MSYQFVSFVGGGKHLSDEPLDQLGIAPSGELECGRPTVNKEEELIGPD
jgi:hypothetical protein